ncbi:EpsG family protein [Dolichospermum lemmermannii CS-548]|uniref:EpsG family protein n=1 Tax=Dolichospermum lemmermannii TaxID=54295 RepID=UPI00232DA0F4|nr:EpsG family protein [Dolichospermum lemmermannii]MDB9436434.1 EpsG family protein [Dolichospermum lemmermannii CS-548]
MNGLQLLFCIPILYFYPVLYPPVACFAAIFSKNKKYVDYISLFLIFSASVVSSLIGATIIPFSDTIEYIESFQESLSSFDISQLYLKGKMEPLYQIYEYCLAVLISDNEKLFLLVNALIFNIISTIAILRICARLNQLDVAYIIISIYYALVAPAMGVPLFLIRSCLSLSILLMGISFYKQNHVICYLLAIIATFMHYYSGLFLVILIFKDLFPKTNKNNKFIRFFNNRYYRVSFVITLLLIIFITQINPNLLNSTLSIILLPFYQSGFLASEKAAIFFDNQTEITNFVDLYNPVFVLQIALSLLCFLEIREDLFYPDQDNYQHTILVDNLEYLQYLRMIGKFQLIVIIITLPFSILPYRLGLFNFLYFPLWLLNIPFLSISKQFSSYKRYLLILAFISVFSFTFYRIPKIQSADNTAKKESTIVLEGKPLNYNLIKLIEYFY